MAASSFIRDPVAAASSSPSSMANLLPTTTVTGQTIISPTYRSSIITSTLLSTQYSNGNPISTITLEDVSTPPVVTLFSTASHSSKNVSSSTSTVSSSGQSLIALISPFLKSGPPLNAGVGAGIGIAVLVLLLVTVGGIFLYLRKRRRLPGARINTAAYDEKPELDDTSFIPELGRFETPRMVCDDRQELEGTSITQTRTTSPAELRAGPYSNRHELEHCNR